MTRQGFMDRVLLSLTRLTAEERENVRQELEEHIEDRMEVMLEMGWKPELAEERCLEAMGDPVEIGREMAKQYRGRGWLWLGRAAVLLTVVLCIQALLGVGILFNAWDSLEARVNPQMGSRLDWTESSERVNLQISMGNDVLRVFRVSVGKWKERRVAEIAMCAYDRWPFGIVAHGWQRYVEINPSDAEAPDRSSNGRGSYGAEYVQTYVELEPGARSVVLAYERFGESQRLEIPLPEGGGAP